jgi:hypothetical protein
MRLCFTTPSTPPEACVAIRCMHPLHDLSVPARVLMMRMRPVNHSINLWNGLCVCVCVCNCIAALARHPQHMSIIRERVSMEQIS